MAKVIFDSELELEDYIFNKVKSGDVCPIDDEYYDMIFRQVNIGDYGIADIVKIQIDADPGCVDSLTVKVLELKKNIIDTKAIIQVIRYTEGIKHFMRLKFPNVENIEIIPQLSAPEINRSDDTTYLINALDSLEIYEIYCNLDIGFASNPIQEKWINQEREFRSLNVIAKEVKNKVVKYNLDYKRHTRDYQSKVINIKPNKAN